MAQSSSAFAAERSRYGPPRGRSRRTGLLLTRSAPWKRLGDPRGRGLRASVRRKHPYASSASSTVRAPNRTTSSGGRPRGRLLDLGERCRGMTAHPKAIASGEALRECAELGDRASSSRPVYSAARTASLADSWRLRDHRSSSPPPIPQPFGDPSRSRTCDLRFRKASLYPAELWDRTAKNLHEGAAMRKPPTSNPAIHRGSLRPDPA